MCMIEIFTDGACEPNPGPGAWAAIVRVDGRETEMTGTDRSTTNNRMEMMAAIMALEALEMNSSVALFSDSEILVKGMSEQARIAKRGKRAAKGDLPNADLWSRLDLLAEAHKIRWNWVKGHSGHTENERCDKLAARALRAMA